MTKQEVDGIHILRVLSCFMVILLHISAGYFHQFSYRWDAALSYDAFTRTCVPLFIMITGYLLIGRQENAFDFYKKRYGKILLPLIFYSLGYYIVINKSLGGFLTALLSGPIEYHLWYMYMLCGLYFVLPFLQKLWLNCSPREKVLILGTWFILHCVFPALSVLSIVSYNPANIFYLSVTGLWGYAFLGAYLKETPKFNGLVSFLIFVIPSVVIIYSTRFFSEAAGTPTAPFMHHLTLPTAIASLGVFMGLRDWKIRWAKPLILQLSNCSFGIYLIHILMIGQIGKRLPGGFYEFSPWIMMPLFSILVFIFSFAIIYPLKKIKFIRLVVG